MQYISIDIETTGLDIENCQVLSIGAVLEDTDNKLPFDEIPKFHAAITRENITGNMFAINMNKELIESIVRYQTNSEDNHDYGMQFYHEDQIVEAFFQWLYINGISDLDPKVDHQMISVGVNKVPKLVSNIRPTAINVAGKNFSSFDKRFLEKLPRWKQAIRVRQRVIDPAPLYIDWKNDQEMPNLKTCKERAGISGDVTHNALEDAWDVVLTLRKFY